ncbi:MAG: tRNA (guanosine(37)-N1)-methyltransferase TrmD [Erysipelotrichaceae bacterium]|nr:tRNA (guanosine(37)-N1)-methyltransferase TrmD [Erysipelotrichaceae bacterium]
MKFSILTLFPEMYPPFLNTSIIKRSLQAGKAEVEVVDIRDFSNDKHRHVDDTPYGGGAGMLMKAGPIHRVLSSVVKENSYVLLTSPKAKPFTQQDARRLAQKEHIVIICGHYEGMDARVENYIDERISIGDYILTGGELPSMVVMDSLIRLQEGAIRKESLDSESYDDGLLEYPQYTKPEHYEGMSVPKVLLSGDHQKIARWRKKQALYETLRYRPDLLKGRALTEEERELLQEIREELQNSKEKNLTV